MSQPEPPASCASCGFRHFQPAWITATERRWVCEKCGECGPVIPPTTLQELETEAKKLPPVVWPPEEFTTTATLPRKPIEAQSIDPAPRHVVDMEGNPLLDMSRPMIYSLTQIQVRNPLQTRRP